MASRVNNGAPVNAFTITVSGADGNVAGDKVSYTCPTGKQAKITFVGWAINTGAPTPNTMVIVGGTSCILSRASATPFQSQGGFQLNPGDICKINVSSTVVGSTLDCMISVEEYLAA